VPPRFFTLASQKAGDKHVRNQWRQSEIQPATQAKDQPANQQAENVGDLG
jgi:hypothetical protein